MIDYEIIKQRAAGFMLKRGWKRLTAKRLEGVYSEQSRRVYPERSRRKQNRFEQARVK